MKQQNKLNNYGFSGCQQTMVSPLSAKTILSSALSLCTMWLWRLNCDPKIRPYAVPLKTMLLVWDSKDKDFKAEAIFTSRVPSADEAWDVKQTKASSVAFFKKTSVRLLQFHIFHMCVQQNTWKHICLLASSAAPWITFKLSHHSKLI